jgi:hypothetical protein
VCPRIGGRRAGPSSPRTLLVPVTDGKHGTSRYGGRWVIAKVRQRKQYGLETSGAF